MANIENRPEITALVYDANGGSHAGGIPLLEDLLVDPNSYTIPTDLMDRDDITDMLAIQSVRMSRMRADFPIHHTKFIK